MLLHVKSNASRDSASVGIPGLSAAARILLVLAAILVLVVPVAHADGVVVPSLNMAPAAGCKACTPVVVFGLLTGTAGPLITNSAVDIYGSESTAYDPGTTSIANKGGSMIYGDVYVKRSNDYKDDRAQGYATGNVLVDPTDVSNLNSSALSLASQAANLAPTQTYLGGGAITRTAALNVIGVTNLTSDLTLSGGPSDVFIVNVSGTINKDLKLNVAGGLTADHVLYNLTSSGDLNWSVNNLTYGTILAPRYDVPNGDGTIHGALFAGGYPGHYNITLMSDMQIKSAPFAGFTSVPEPTPAVFLVTGIVLIAIGRLRRSRPR